MSAPHSHATRVLLVGYASADRERLERELSARHYDLTVAGSELEAVRLLDRERIAAVLLDLAAPELDGLRSVRHLCASTAGTAVIVLTAVNDAAVAASCFREGAADYLLQPADPAALDATLQAAVQRRRA